MRSLKATMAGDIGEADEVVGGMNKGSDGVRGLKNLWRRVRSDNRWDHDL